MSKYHPPKITWQMLECLDWLVDDTAEFGMPGGQRTLDALVRRGFAVNASGRWAITEAGARARKAAA